MGEPLFDGVSAAIVLSGAAAIIVLRSAESASADRNRRLGLIGHLLLGVSISLLLYRWVDAVTSLPADARPSSWHSGALAVACGIGLVAAMKALIGLTASNRIQNFVIATLCGAAALMLAAAWEWAWLILTLLASGVARTLWIAKRADRNAASHRDADEPLREPALVLLVSAALLLLLLGTWQHVVEHETQRKTRSPRYSAWPRATALSDAWERTGWTVKPNTSDADARLPDAASREQHVALGLAVLLLVVVATAWCPTEPTFADSETDHAG